MDIAVSESTIPFSGPVSELPGGAEFRPASLLEARKGVSSMVIHGGRLDGVLLDKHQFAAHGYAWLATYVAGLQQMLVWAERLEELGQLTDSRTCCCRARMANTWRKSPAASR